VRQLLADQNQITRGLALELSRSTGMQMQSGVFSAARDHSPDRLDHCSDRIFFYAFAS